MNRYIITTILFLFTITFISCENDEIDDSQLGGEYKIKIKLNHKAGPQPFQANTNFTNAMNEVYKIDRFHYYISNVALISSINGQPEKENESYHLIKAEVDSTTSFTYKVNSNQLNQLQFFVGVDSLRNVSGAQSGALDPLNGMFWTWNSGYIMAKMEGTSLASTSINNMMVYHIGGFSGQYNTVRPITINLPDNINTPRNGTCTISLDVDINKFFNGAHTLKIADSSISMSHGELSAKYADNYATMFKFNTLTNQ